MSYKSSRVSEIFSRNESYPKRTFEEVNLPFDDLEIDYIEGEGLRESLTSSAVKEAMGDYSISSVWSEDKYETIMAKKSHSNLSFLTSSDPYISFKGRPDALYSHLRVELAASEEEVIEELCRDLDALEEGLEKYFRPEENTEQEKSQLLTAD
jgi:hypothetical protein